MSNDINTKDPNECGSIRLRLASPADILSWSYGEVTKPETINYRTQRSEKNGLFDEKIFGPDKDYECYCGKYRGVRYKGIVCEKCGVEITRSIVRRERMGHIELATPVSHIWFLKGMPSRIALMLGITSSDVEKVVYFSGYIITSVNEEERKRVLKDLESEFKSKIKNAENDTEKKKIEELMDTARQDIEIIKERTVLDEIKYHNFSVRYGSIFEAGIGAEVIYEMLRQIDLKELEKELQMKLDAGEGDSIKTTKRLALVRSMIHAEQRPEWMFLTHIPVIPPAMRPMVPLDGGRFATSDVNDLYRRVINRNTRLKKLREMKAPDVILRNEKRIMQEAVDALIDNSVRQGQSQQQLSPAQKRPLKSIADNLKGKRGLFRSNLLGKRVDYSGRSVIVVGPSLALDQCGLPKHMALELFKPFVISQLLKQELAYNIRGASRLIEEGIPEVWAILEEVIKEKYVLLNRAPTLHRLGIQAFRPMLIEGNAIQIHPLVCTAFNADFDGDQMAVHVPLSREAQLEAKEIMAADKNVFKPGSGDPIIAAKLDIVLGCYWMTKIIEGDKGEGRYFESPEEALLALDAGVIDIRAKIKVLAPDTVKFAKHKDSIFDTTAGRIMFNDILPEEYPFVNEEVERKRMMGIVNDLIDQYGSDSLPTIMDSIKDFGFKNATRAGVTWGIDEVIVPEGKGAVIEAAQKKNDAVQEQYESGLLSREERLRKGVEIWLEAKNDVEALIPDTLSPKDSLYDMWKSGARASLNQITQMAGMKGLIQSTGGGTIEFPVLASMKEGLAPIEYFTTTHGSRKGLSDTALKTAQSGYLTRRLFDVAQDAVVSEEDCGTKQSITVSAHSASGMEGTLSRHVVGRYLADDIKDGSGKILFKKGHYLTRKDAEDVQSAGVEDVVVRSPLTCETLHGICKACYGHDFGRGQIVEIGEAVGTVAAQAIGEPGTQLTMRTFHAGGAASAGGDITQGLPRVEEVFEKRKPKSPAAISHVDGVITEIKHNTKEHVISILPSAEYVKKGKKEKTEEYTCDSIRTVLVREGDEVKKGTWLTDGSADIDELFKKVGRDFAQDYIISEIIKLYELQGESVSRKHIELIVRQMFSRRKIVDPNDTPLSPGNIVEESTLLEMNRTAREAGKEEATATITLMGITEISLSRRSFLSSASFQHTARVLIDAAVKGATDPLDGLKENVILGRLIPAGTGFEGSPKSEMIKNAQSSK